MVSTVRDRLEQAIREEDARRLDRLKSVRQTARGAEERFEPIRQAAEEIREQLQPLAGIEFTISPDSVWITLADRELSFGYDPAAQRFIGEETAHSWYDGEPYTATYQWATSESCIEAMIRLCARYARMANAIRGGAPSGGS